MLGAERLGKEMVRVVGMGTCRQRSARKQLARTQRQETGKQMPGGRALTTWSTRGKAAVRWLEAAAEAAAALEAAAATAAGDRVWRSRC